MERLNLGLDLGGILSLVVTIAIIVVALVIFDGFEVIIGDLEKISGDPFRITTVLILIPIGVIALWLAVRVIGLYALRRYIFTEGYNYNPRDIFNILTYILTANLCFTLTRTLMFVAENTSNTGNTVPSVLKGYIDVAIQAAIVGFLTLLPRYGDDKFLKKIGGSHGYTLIVISVIVSIVAFVFVRLYI